MARILVVDDEASVRMIVEENLLEQHFAVETADRPSLALAAAARSRPDLVVSDVNMPEMFGFDLRRELRKIPGCESVPFLFMSGADPRAELRIAADLGGDRILLKPFAGADLLRAVRVLLGAARSASGDVVASLEPFLGAIAAGHESGILTAARAAASKRFVFREGKLIFAASSDPKDLIGQAMLRIGVIRERDLLAAIVSPKSDTSRPALASALEQMQKLTPAQCDAAFATKLRETLLELVVWDEGRLEFLGGAVDGADAPFPLEIDAGQINAEVAKRRARWALVKKTLPAPHMKLERAAAWPAGFPKNVGDEHLARHLERGLSLEELFLEMRGQRYAVGLRLAEFLRTGTLRAVEPTGFSGSAPEEASEEELARAREELELSQRLEKVSAHPAVPVPHAVAPPVEPPPEVAPAPPATSVTTVILTQALVRFRAGDLTGARDAFRDVLTVDPMSALARLRLQEVEEALAKQTREKGMNADVRVGLARPLSELVGIRLAPSAAFMLSRLARGPLTIRELMVLSPMPEQDLLAILEDFIAQKLIERTG